MTLGFKDIVIRKIRVCGKDSIPLLIIVEKVEYVGE